MDIKDLKNKTEKDLKELLAENRDELRQLRFRISNGELKQVHKVKDAKKTVARILTILKSKSKIQVI